MAAATMNGTSGVEAMAIDRPPIQLSISGEEEGSSLVEFRYNLWYSSQETLSASVTISLKQISWR